MEKYYVMPSLPTMTTKESVVCEYIGKIYDSMNHIREIRTNENNEEVKALNDIYYKLYMLLGQADLDYVIGQLNIVGSLMSKLKENGLLEKNTLAIVARSKKNGFISRMMSKKKIKKEDMVLSYVQSMMKTNDVLLSTLKYINNKDAVL